MNVLQILDKKMSMTGNISNLDSRYVFSKDFIDEFMQSSHARNVRLNSRKMYKSVLNQFYTYLYQAVANPQHVEQNDIFNFKEGLISEGKKATTVQNYVAVLKIFFKFLADVGLYPNIARDIKAEKPSRAFKKKDLNIDQSKALLASINPSTLASKRDLAMLALMVVCGLRTIEVSRANVGSIEKSADGVFLHVQGKGRVDDTDIVKIPSDVAKIIDSYINARKPYRESDPLFVSISNNSRGKRLSTVTISTVAKKALTSIGLVGDQYTAHSLRHSAASNAIRAGVSLEEVSKLLRHKSLNTTMIYNHAIEARNNRASIRVAEAIFHAKTAEKSKAEEILGERSGFRVIRES